MTTPDADRLCRAILAASKAKTPERGRLLRQLARYLGVALRTAQRRLALYQQRGSCQPRRRGPCVVFTRRVDRLLRAVGLDERAIKAERRKLTLRPRRPPGRPRGGRQGL